MKPCGGMLLNAWAKIFTHYSRGQKAEVVALLTYPALAAFRKLHLGNSPGIFEPHPHRVD
jgi:hypothetical protein